MYTVPLQEIQNTTEIGIQWLNGILFLQFIDQARLLTHSRRQHARAGNDEIKRNYEEISLNLLHKRHPSWNRLHITDRSGLLALISSDRLYPSSVSSRFQVLVNCFLDSLPRVFLSNFWHAWRLPAYHQNSESDVNTEEHARETQEQYNLHTK